MRDCPVIQKVIWKYGITKTKRKQGKERKTREGEEEVAIWA